MVGLKDMGMLELVHYKLGLLVWCEYKLVVVLGHMLGLVLECNLVLELAVVVAYTTLVMVVEYILVVVLACMLVLELVVASLLELFVAS